MKHSILIVEDEAFIAALYKEEIEQHGVSVTLALNGKVAEQHLKKHRYDMLLLDLMMPEMDGYALLETCKKNGIPVPITLVITNLSRDVTKEKCKELGAKDVIVKSDVDAADVWNLVKKHLPPDNAVVKAKRKG